VSGLALWVGRNGRPANRDEARELADAGSHRARQGTREALTKSAVAIHLEGGQEAALAPGSPHLAPEGSLLIVADARIDNRRDVARTLGVPELAAQRDDTRLLLQAYRQWGDTFADYLAGDFAIAIWDESRRRLVAARDRFAMRPLYYRIEPERMFVASEVSQILAVKGVPSRPFEPQLMASLARVPGLGTWTFYEGIERVPPGHTLVADDAGTRVAAHASMGDAAPARGNAKDWAEQLRTELTAAVLARVEALSRPGLLLSGGLDSMSIGGIVGMLRQSGQVNCELLAYGFAYDELKECDERSVSTVVSDRYGFTSRLVPADSAWPLAGYPAHGPAREGPDRLRSHVLLARTIEMARGDGVTCLISGYRGDAILGGHVVDYLGALSNEGVVAMWRALTEHSRRTGVSRSALLKSHVIRRLPAALWPRGRVSILRNVARRVGPRAKPLPEWLRPDAIRRFDPYDLKARGTPLSSLPGEARRRRHDGILKPEDARSAEGVERLLAGAGIRYVDPWADRRLAELALRIPQYVITPAGEPKRLLREAMRGVIPEPARVGAGKRSPQPLYVRGLADRARSVILSLIDGSRAASLGYVDEAALRRAYERFVDRPERVSDREWRALWRFIDVEEWLRRYHT
jgi:asparagine synthase (glutamine-hydrolysing)